MSGLASQLSELIEYLAHYLQATLDNFRLKGRQGLRDLELEIIVVLAVAGLIVVGATLLFQGIAGGLAQLFGDHPWLGNVGAGLLLLGCTVLAMAGWRKAMDKAARERIIQKYEQRKLRQREKFGRDVAEQAAARRDERG